MIEPLCGNCTHSLYNHKLNDGSCMMKNCLCKNFLLSKHEDLRND